MARILIVTDAWKPQTNGVVRCLESLDRELRRGGQDVVFLTPESFWTVPMPTYPEIQLALAPIGAVAAFIDSAGADHIHIATEGPLGFQARMHCEGAGLSFTSSYHTRFPEYLAARLPFMPGVPAELSYAYLRWFHSGAAATLVPTQSIAAELRTHGFGNVRTWSRGVDGELFSPGPKTAFGDLPGPHLLYVGRVSVEKNITAFLDLDVPGTKIVVGDGPQLAELRAAYPEAVFMGHRTGAELTAFYRSADVLVFPSKTDTFGNVLVEALSCGVPVAAYPVAGPVDVLTDPACGVMDEDLGTAVRAALKLSRTAARRHAQSFSWEQCAREFRDVLVPAAGRREHAA